jgi:hypothetical protein
MVRRHDSTKPLKSNIFQSIYIAITMTIILLILLELAIFAYSEYYYSQNTKKKLVGYDDDHTSYLNDFKELRKGEGDSTLFCPYLGHCTGKFSSQKYNLLGNGERKTINPCVTENSTLIYVLGGSTTISAKVFDEHTWSSQLSKKLCDAGYDVEVRNFGQSGYINTQEMIKLVFLLKEEAIPDYVLFFDGSNEYYAAYQNGDVNTPQNNANMARAFSILRDRNLLNPFFGTSTFRALRFINKDKQLVYTDNETMLLANQLKLNYIANARIINGLSLEYGFVPLHVWQATIFTKSPLSSYEEDNIDKYGHKELVIKGSYANTSLLDESIEHFYDLTNMFDDLNETIFVDHVHTSVRGEEIIASNIAKIIISKLESNINTSIYS